MARVEALLREREGYVRRGLIGRVAQVDAELARYGVAVEVAVVEPDHHDVPAHEAAVDVLPRERRGRGRARP